MMFCVLGLGFGIAVAAKDLMRLKVKPKIPICLIQDITLYSQPHIQKPVTTSSEWRVGVDPCVSYACGHAHYESIRLHVRPQGLFGARCHGAACRADVILYIYIYIYIPLIPCTPKLYAISR